MRRYPLTFNFPTGGGAANATSTPEIVAFCVGKVVQIGGTFSATVDIQGRVSSSDAYVSLGTFTAGAIFPVEPAFYDLRIVITGWISGTVTASFAGFNAQGG